MTRSSRRSRHGHIALSPGGRAIEVLAFLRGGPTGFVSGADISRALKISRTAVWKHVGRLREAGYVIEAHPSKGYRLLESPDLLLPAELQQGLETRFVGREIHHLLSADSTNRVAHVLAEQGAVEGTTVIAEEQTRGRGRLGRSWYSPPRVNVYASIILRPRIPAAQVPQLTLVGAVAAARAIISVYDGPPDLLPRIKWPNDIMIGSRKISGTLVETTTVGETLGHVVMGIGINVNLAEKDLPKELSGIATSLSIAAGHPVSRQTLTRRLFSEIEACYMGFCNEGFRKLSEEYASLCDLWGRNIRVTLPDRVVEGIAEGLYPDGALRVKKTGGDMERILAGDVQLLR
jgi:BirA family biotin operon repressor/biotin-[acetyl-CoA-carboxylase] ligase